MKTPRPVPARVEGPKPSDPSSITVPLRRPLRLESGDLLPELMLRRPTAADIRGLPLRVLRRGGNGVAGATWGDMLQVVAGCIGHKLEELDTLGVSDTRAAVEAMSSFLAVDVKAERAARVRELGAALHMDLAKPLTLGSEKLETLVLQECTARHIREMPVEPAIADLLDLGSRLSLQPAAIVDRFDVRDALLLISICADFFDDSRPTGASRS